MRQLAYLGVAALTAVALLGTSCSSDSTGNGGGGDTGGAANVGGQTGNTGGATSTGTKATGGATTASTSAKTGQGGATGVGGVTGQGGANVGGVTGQGGAATGGGSSVPVTGGLDIVDSFYTDGTFKGAVWVTSDEVNAKRSDVAHTTIALPVEKDEMCVTGFAPKIPLKEPHTSASDYDYSEVWGADLGWNLNETAGVDGGEGTKSPADFSDVTSVTVNLEGATGLNMRVQLTTLDDQGAEVYYCATLPLTGSAATIDLTTLKTSCWQAGGKAFDPATMQPVSFALAVVTSATKEYPINFCVTELKFNTDADGG
jgi:hypothetical protein